MLRQAKESVAINCDRRVSLDFMGLLNPEMDADSQLKDTLAITVSNAISRMEELKNPLDQLSIFHEYQEWLEQDINNEVWALPSDWNCPKNV